MIVLDPSAIGPEADPMRAVRLMLGRQLADAYREVLTEPLPKRFEDAIRRFGGPGSLLPS